MKSPKKPNEPPNAQNKYRNNTRSGCRKKESLPPAPVVQEESSKPLHPWSAFLICAACGGVVLLIALILFMISSLVLEAPLPATFLAFVITLFIAFIAGIGHIRNIDHADTRTLSAKILAHLSPLQRRPKQ